MRPITVFIILLIYFNIVLPQSFINIGNNIQSIKADKQKSNSNPKQKRFCENGKSYTTIVNGIKYTIYLKSINDKEYELYKESKDNSKDNIEKLNEEYFIFSFLKLYESKDTSNKIFVVQAAEKIFNDIMRDYEIYTNDKRNNNRINALSQRIQVLEKQTKEKIGILKFANISRKAKVYRKNDIQKKEILKIKLIEFAFEDGLIKQIQVKGQIKNQDITFYSENPISVRIPSHIYELSEPKLYKLISSKNSDDYINISDVFYYDVDLKWATGNYVPQNGVVILDKDSIEVKLFKENIIDLFDIKLFTDVTGFQKNNPNGLVQFELSYPFQLFSDPIFGIQHFYGLRYFKPYLKFSKIEEKLSSLPFQKFTETKNNYTSVFDLMKYSKLNVGFEFNMINLIYQSSKLKLNISGGFIRTGIDSIWNASSNKLNTNEDDLTSFYIYPELIWLSIPDPYLDFDLRLGCYLIKNIDKQLTVVRNKRASSNSILNNASFLESNIWNIQANFNIHPDPKKKETSIFFRLGFLFKERENNFTLHVGYATPLTSLFTK